MKHKYEFDDYDRKVMLDALELLKDNLQTYQKDLEREEDMDESEIDAVILKLDTIEKIYSAL